MPGYDVSAIGEKSEFLLSLIVESFDDLHLQAQDFGRG